jgi:hypothetical protein
MTDRSFGQSTNNIPSFNPVSFKNITTTGLSNFSPDKRKRWIIIEEVTVETFNLQLTSAEEELSRWESLEIRALLKRDTTALRNIWLRDFTLDEPHNKIHIDSNPIPNYVSLWRLIDRFTVSDNHAYVTGVEYAIQLNHDGREQIKRKYTHLWVKKLWTWKLAAKTYE